MLLVFTYEDKASAEYKLVEQLLPRELKELVKTKEFTGKKLQTTLLRTPKRAFKKLLLVGLGKKEGSSLETLRRAAGTALKAAREFSDEVTVPFLDSGSTRGLDEAVQAVTEGFILGHYRFLKYKTQDLDDLKTTKKFTILVERARQAAKAKQGLERGAIMAEATNYARDLVNTPPTDLNPATLEKEAKKLAKKHGLAFTVFNAAELKKRKMNAILAVGSGKQHEAPDAHPPLQEAGSDAQDRLLRQGRHL